MERSRTKSYTNLNRLRTIDRLSNIIIIIIIILDYDLSLSIYKSNEYLTLVDNWLDRAVSSLEISHKEVE